MYSLELDRARPLLTAEAPATAIDPLACVTLRHCGIVHGPGGERFRVLGLAAPGRWAATRLERDRLTANFQGNPLWPVDILSDYPRLARLFGLYPSLSARACVIPTAETINARIAELTADDEVQFRFRAVDEYRSSCDGTIGEQDYVDTFIDEAVFPISPIATKDSLHDWSYHFMTLLFPRYAGGIRAALARVRARSVGLDGEVSRVWNYFGHTLDERGNFKPDLRTERLPYRAAIYRQMAITLDSATAKPVQLLAMKRRGRLDRCAGEVEAASQLLAGVSAETLQRVLFLERPQTLVEAPARRTDASAPDIISYMGARLDQLDQRARELVDDRLAAARQAAFAAYLAEVDALLLEGGR